MSETATPRKRRPSLRRAIREAAKAGVTVTSATIDADGKIRLEFGERDGDNGDDLDRELAAFEGRHGQA
jgi:hypothetical protein